MKTFNVAILGGGFIGKMHVYAIQTLPFYSSPTPAEVKIRYVVNSRPETAAMVAKLAPGAMPLTDFREAIQDPEIDIVNICLPNDLHFPALKMAIATQKHIYCEKPVVLNAQEAEEIESLLTDYHGVSHVVFHIRFFASAMYAKELIKAGKIGKVVEFRGHYLQNSHVDPNRPTRWKNLRANGGGALMDIGSHLIDFADWLAGPLTEVSAFSRSMVPENVERAEDSIVTIWKTAHRAVGTLHISKAAHGTENDMLLEIYGTQGAIRFNLENPHFLEYFDGQKPTSPFGGESGWTRIPVGNRYPGSDTDFPATKSGIGWSRAHCTSFAHFLWNVVAGQNLDGSPDLARGIYVQKLLERCRS
ncbi:MAG: Gfo/Idh/MocA family oxidoreductase [Planctomycetia bacterium]|nr:Gfo/Idh/MocA family oxidoreductase [Planctomycetia bacterium]